jgi:glycosyltransferase 2 family protein
VLFSFATADNNLFQIMLHFSPVYFIIAMVVSVVPWFTGSLRLFLWSKCIGRYLSYRNVFKVVLGAELGAAVIPPPVGGNGAKVGMLMLQGLPGGSALSLTVLESLQDIIFFILAVPVALTLSSSWDLPIITNSLGSLRHLPIWILLGLICAVFFVVLMLVKRCACGSLLKMPYVKIVAEKIKHLYHTIVETYSIIIRNGKGMFVLTMALTSIQWICRCSIISLLLMSLGIAAQPVLFMVLQVLVFALMTVVPTPGAMGGAEVIFSLLYQALLPEGTIGVVTTGWRFLTFYFLVIVSFLLFLFLDLQNGATQKEMKQNLFSSIGP